MKTNPTKNIIFSNTDFLKKSQLTFSHVWQNSKCSAVEHGQVYYTWYVEFVGFWRERDGMSTIRSSYFSRPASFRPQPPSYACIWQWQEFTIR